MYLFRSNLPHRERFRTFTIQELHTRKPQRWYRHHSRRHIYPISHQKTFFKLSTSSDLYRRRIKKRHHHDNNEILWRRKTRDTHVTKWWDVKTNDGVAFIESIRTSRPSAWCMDSKLSTVHQKVHVYGSRCLEDSHPVRLQFYLSEKSRWRFDRVHVKKSNQR